MKKEYSGIIQEYLDENLDMNDTDLTDLILEDRAINKSHRTIRRYLITIRGESSLEAKKKQDIQISDKFEKEIEINDYVEPIKESAKKEKTEGIDANLIDQIFCAYSRKGLNYSGPSIMSVLEVDKKIFSTLVSKQGLCKESEPLSPQTISTLSAVERNDRIARISANLLEKFAEADSGIAESIVKEYKKKYTDLVFESSQKKEMYEHLLDKLPQLDIQIYDYKPSQLQGGILFVVIGDMHIGLEASGFNLSAARLALATMSNNINAVVKRDGHSEVRLLFLGDIPHTVSGVNHANMWKDIEPGLWGAESMIKPYELLSQFIASTYNITKIYAVGGNHGRLADRKDLEPTDEGEKLIFYMIQNSFKDIEVFWDPDKVIFSEGSLTFILLHGDQRQDTRPGQEIAWNLGKGNSYNLVLVGHTHSRQINKNDDGQNFRRMVCPAFCPTDSYAERLGYNSLPGYLLIREDMNGYPIITDLPIHYPKSK